VIKESAYGKDHVDVANTLVNLSIAYGSLGDYSEAEGSLERA